MDTIVLIVIVAVALGVVGYKAWKRKQEKPVATPAPTVSVPATPNTGTVVPKPVEPVTPQNPGIIMIGGIPAGIGSGGGTPVVVEDRAPFKNERYGGAMPGPGGWKVWFSGPDQVHSLKLPVNGRFAITWDNGYNDMDVFFNGVPVNHGDTVEASGDSTIIATTRKNDHTIAHGSGPNAIQLNPQ